MPGRLSLLRTVGRAIRIVRAGGVVSGAAGLSGCGRHSVLRPISAEAGALAWLTTVFFVMTLLVFAAVVGLYLVPLMIGTRNVAFPRLNLFGYYTFLFGGCFLFAGLLMRTAPQAGWFSYVPLASLRFAPEKGVDIWAQTISFTELAALIAAVEIAVTALKLRAPGMSLGRMPIVVWSMLIMSAMVILAMPAIMVASALLAMDRLVSTRFFTVDAGGDVILWQHLFWFEWATSSPPPAFNHDPLPCVTSASPRWGARAPVVAGLRCDQREILITSAGAARPSHRTVLDGPAISPLLLGVATAATQVGVVFTPWAIVWGSPLCLAALAVWFWPWTRHL